jgi:hypothetical protein
VFACRPGVTARCEGNRKPAAPATYFELLENVSDRHREAVWQDIGRAVRTSRRPLGVAVVVTDRSNPYRSSRTPSREVFLFPVRPRDIGTYRPVRRVTPGVTRTVHELRNDVRVAVDRFERRGSTGFTKETLAAVCTAVGYEIDTDEFPSKARMRAGILWRVGELPEDDPEKAPGQFRKAELQAIAAAVESD